MFQIEYLKQMAECIRNRDLGLIPVTIGTCPYHPYFYSPCIDYVNLC